MAVMLYLSEHPNKSEHNTVHMRGYNWAKVLVGVLGYCHTLLRDFTFISTLSLSVINTLGMFTDDFSIFLYQNGLCWLIYLNAACAIVYRQGSSWFILMRL